MSITVDTPTTGIKRVEEIAANLVAASSGRCAEQARALAAILTGTQAVLSEDDFAVAARRIFDTCCTLTGATAGYVALLSDDGEENELLFLEAGNRPCSVDPELPMPIRGLRELAYNTRRACYDNDFMKSEWLEFMPAGHVALDNVLFSPLNIDDKTVGIIGIANKPADFTQDDALVAEALGDLAAFALANSRTRHALAKTKDRLQSLFDNMLHGFAYHRMVFDEEGEPIDYVFVDTNETFLTMTGLDGDIIGRAVTEVIPSIRDDDTDWIGIYGEVVRTGQPTMFTSYAGQLKRWYSISAYRFETGHFAVITEDVTEAKQAEAHRLRLERQALEAQKLESLGLLAGGIAHDFNNLLMAILGNADLALQDTPTSSPARECIEDIATASKRAAELCRQMLAYSGKGRFVVEKTNLNELIEEMTAMLRVSISKKATLSFKLAEDIPTVMADLTQMRQLIMNLLTNASEALDGKIGTITITTGQQECDDDYLTSTFGDIDLKTGSYVYLEVSDTGCGMDAITRDRIFEPFFSTKFTGRGLGLAATQGIVRGHGGAIKVYSELDRGTTFKILFPAFDTATTTSTTATEETEQWRGSGTVLLVDDEATVRKTASRMLARMGFTVLTAENGKEAVELFSLRRQEICCILLDLTMPVLGGEEAFRQLRAIDVDVPVVLSSGYNEQEATQLFVGKGLAGFIQKPYRTKELRKTLESLLGTD